MKLPPEPAWATRIRSWALTALIVVLTVTIAWSLYSYATGRSVSSMDLLVEMRTQNCVLSIPVEQRTEEATQQCRQEALDSVNERQP
jgi:hypothetical protein